MTKFCLILYLCLSEGGKGGSVVCVCVYKSIKTDTDTKLQQPNEYLNSLLLVSVQTPLVYEGSPAFDAAAQEGMEKDAVTG